MDLPTYRNQIEEGRESLEQTIAKEPMKLRQMLLWGYDRMLTAHEDYYLGRDDYVVGNFSNLLSQSTSGVSKANILENATRLFGGPYIDRFGHRPGYIMMFNVDSKKKEHKVHLGTGRYKMWDQWKVSVLEPKHSSIIVAHVLSLYRKDNALIINPDGRIIGSQVHLVKLHGEEDAEPETPMAELEEENGFSRMRTTMYAAQLMGVPGLLMSEERKVLELYRGTQEPMWRYQLPFRDAEIKRSELDLGHNEQAAPVSSR